MGDFASNLTDIWYGNEVEVSIGYYDSTEWVYEVIEYREGFSPDNPDNTEGIYDGLVYKGDKRIQVEKTVDFSQRFRGFGVGLDKFENLAGMVVKLEIVPDGGEIPADVESTMYLTNLNTSNSNLDDVPNQGEFNISLSGRWDEKVYEEPDGTEDWVVEHDNTFTE